MPITRARCDRSSRRPPRSSVVASGAAAASATEGPAPGPDIRRGVPRVPAGSRWCADCPRPSSRAGRRTPAGRRRRRAPARAARPAWLQRRRPRSTPASSRRASAARARLVSVSGRRGRAASAPGGVAPVEQDPGQRLGRLGVVGLELEGLAQRGLVTLLDEQIGLARGRGQPLHERGHLVLGQGADELVHHLATADGEDGRDGLHREASGPPWGSRRR